MVRSLELFSGAGGLAKGLEKAGFNHVAFVEFNKHACDSLKMNFDEKKVFCGDIRDYDFSTINNIDVVAGGPPCQPFSLGGKHKASEDLRDMFPYAIKAIEHLMPKAFIFENVKGLLRPSFANYFSYILLQLTFPDCKPKRAVSWEEHLRILKNIDYSSYQGVKYNVSYELVNAADFGVPQQRERVVIVGVRSDLNHHWTFPQKTHFEEKLLWDKYVTGEYWELHNVPKNERDQPSEQLKKYITCLKSKSSILNTEIKSWVTIRDALSHLPEPEHKHNISDHIFRAGAKVYAGHTGSAYDHPAKTIKAGAHGVPGGENMIRFYDGSVRYFTVHEAKLLQTFPENYCIQGTWGEAMRQIGNAVPVILAEKIGNELRYLLQKSLKVKKVADQNIHERFVNTSEIIAA